MDFESEILRLAAQNDETIRQLFDDYFNELAAYGVRTPKKDGIFSFEKDLPPKEREAVKELTKDFQEKLYQQIHFGIDVAVGISLAKDVEFLRANFPEGLNIHQPRRKDAREAFVRQRTKPAGRLSLSDRVWNYTNQSKAEAEAAMSLAIEDGVVQGKTAAELGRELRKYLNDPDRMYRRYHKKIVDSTGAKRDVVVWKKRVIGADGQVHFVDADLEKTGQGVYRSARKNAERCSRSEINSAYRYSDYERWNDEEFVIGIKIALSNNHTVKKEIRRGNRHIKIDVPFHDICDDLQGIYPKSFKWAGWHPQCRCHATAVTASKEEKMRWLAEGCPKGYFDNQQVKKAPANFVKYVAKNKEKIASAKSLPFWVQDNLKLQKTPAGAEKVVNLLGLPMRKPAAMIITNTKLTPLEVAAQRHATRTAEEARAIQSAWNKHRKAEMRRYVSQLDKDNTMSKSLKHWITYNIAENKNGVLYDSGVEKFYSKLRIAQAQDARWAKRNAETIQRRWNARILEREKFFSRYTKIEDGAIRNKITDLLNELYKKENATKPINKELLDRVRRLYKNAEIATARHKTRNSQAILDAWKKRGTKGGFKTNNLGAVADRAGQRVDYLNVELHKTKLTEEEIIVRLGGRDKTTGSCSSLAFAFAGQCAGYDVIDFRGGSSQQFFSTNFNIWDIGRRLSPTGTPNWKKYLSKQKVLDNLEEGKRYYFAAGRHAAVVRVHNGELQYLELQAGQKGLGGTYRDGWHKLDRDALKWRFKGTYKHMMDENWCIVIPFEDLQGDAEFRRLLGYINTRPERQMKGEGGSIK